MRLDLRPCLITFLLFPLALTIQAGDPPTPNIIVPAVGTGERGYSGDGGPAPRPG